MPFKIPISDDALHAIDFAVAEMETSSKARDDTEGCVLLLSSETLFRNCDPQPATMDRIACLPISVALRRAILGWRAACDAADRRAARAALLTPSSTERIENRLFADPEVIDVLLSAEQERLAKLLKVELPDWTILSQGSASLEPGIGIRRALVREIEAEEAMTFPAEPCIVVVSENGSDWSAQRCQAEEIAASAKNAMETLDQCVWLPLDSDALARLDLGVPARNVGTNKIENYVLVMYDIGSKALWARGGVPMAAAELPVSHPIRHALAIWQLRSGIADDLYNCNEPDYIEPEWPAEYYVFVARSLSDEGLSIARRIKAELPNWEVEYLDVWGERSGVM